MSPKEIIASADMVAIVTSYGVEVKKRGHSYLALCQYHDEAKPSMTVVPASGGEKGFVHCFACGAHDDAAGFVMHMSGCGFPEAVRKIGGANVEMTRIKRLIKAEPKLPTAIWHPVRPETDEPPNFALGDFGQPDTIHAYRYPDGWPIMYAARYGRKSSKFMTRFWTFGRLGEIMAPPKWSARPWFPEPAPLYNLPDLDAKPGGQVIFTESELSADAVAALAPAHVSTTWPGGAWFMRYADYSPIAGRRCLLIPDNDDVSRQCFSLLAAILYYNGAAEVRGIDAQTDDADGREVDLPPGWCIADAQDWTGAKLRDWAARRTLVYPKASRASQASTNPPETRTAHAG